MCFNPEFCLMHSHLMNLAQVLEHLDSARMNLKWDENALCLPQVEYLGHIISEEGLLAR